MRADKRCETCEWWDIDGPLYDRQRQCLRWPGDPWLWTEEDRRCWQHAKRTSETEESATEVVPDDLRDATRLVIEAGLSTGHADTCVDLVSEVLEQMREFQERVYEGDELREIIPQLNLRLALAQRLFQQAIFIRKMPKDWDEEVLKWLKAE